MNKEQKFIDLDVAKRKLNYIIRKYSWDANIKKEIEDTLRRSIAYDAVLQKRMKWITDASTPDSGLCRCSNCNAEFYISDLQQVDAQGCPRCLAKLKTN